MSFFPERRHARFEFTQFPWIFSLQVSEPAAEDQPLRVEARNISQGGIKFVSNRKIPLFDEVRIQVLSRTGHCLAQIQGKVVRVEEVDTGLGEKTYGIGVEFTAGMEALAPLIPLRESQN